MKLSQLRNLLAIAEAGTVRQAARNLNLSQSSVTKSIQQLEEGLKVELFHRGPQGLSPTAAGKALIARAKVIEAEMRQARNDIDEVQGAKGGEIRIIASPSVSVGLLPRAISAFKRLKPRVTFNIQEGVYPDVLPMVRMGEVDFAITLVPEMIPDEELTHEMLLRDYLTPAVRRDHPLTQMGKLKLANLLDRDWVVYRRSRTGRDIFERSFISNKLEPPKCAIECTSFSLALALVENGDYLTLVPTQLFSDRTRRMPITPLFMETSMPPWDVVVISRAKYELSPICLAFLKELHKAAEKSRLAAI
jgi:LysR family transcriptional regulator of abg operon